MKKASENTTYDPMGQVIAEYVSVDSNSIEYYYNDLGKVDEEVKRDGESIYYGYDNIGNMLWESNDPDGNEVDANYVSAFEYDGKNRKTYAVKYEDGSFVADSNFFYNGFGLISKEQASLFNLDTFTIEYDYDQSGNMTSITFDDEQFEYTHDGLNRIKTVQRNDEDVVEYTYIGANAKSVDYIEANIVEHKEYDEIGRVSRVYSIEDGQSDNILDLQYLYDSSSNRSSVKYNHLTSPVWDKYTYDRLNRVTDVEYGSSTPPVAYFNNEQFYYCYKEAMDWLVEDVIVGQDKFVKLDDTKKKQIQQNIDFISKLNNIDTSDMPIVALSVMAEDKETTTEYVKNEDGNTIAKIVYDKDSNMLEFTMYLDDGGWGSVISEYDKDGTLTSEIFYTYDADGNLIDTVDMTAQAEFFAQQAVAAPMESMAMSSGVGGVMMSSSGEPEAPVNNDEEFVYDLLGNRKTRNTRLDFVETYTTEPNVNQYSNVHSNYGFGLTSDVNYVWDDNGNLESEDRFDYEYSYDYRNRLVKIEDDTSTVVDYTYDALGRRIRKLIDGDARVYYYDTMGRVLVEYVSADANTVEYDRSFVYGNGYDETLAMYLPQYDGDANVAVLGDFCAMWLLEDTDTGFDPNFDYDSNDYIDFYDFAGMADDANYCWDLSDRHEAKWYYLHDGLGSVMGLVGARYAREDDREFYLYDVYGKPSGTESAESGNPYGFAGMRYDGESGLYHTLYRNYEPEMGRWIQTDPLGTVPNDDKEINYFAPRSQFKNGSNLYNAFSSNPVNVKDLYGLDCKYDGFAIVYHEAVPLDHSPVDIAKLRAMANIPIIDPRMGVPGLIYMLGTSWVPDKYFTKGMAASMGFCGCNVYSRVCYWECKTKKNFWGKPIGKESVFSHCKWEQCCRAANKVSGSCIFQYPVKTYYTSRCADRINNKELGLGKKFHVPFTKDDFKKVGMIK